MLKTVIRCVCCSSLLPMYIPFYTIYIDILLTKMNNQNFVSNQLYCQRFCRRCHCIAQRISVHSMSIFIIILVGVMSIISYLVEFSKRKQRKTRVNTGFQHSRGF